MNRGMKEATIVLLKKVDVMEEEFMYVKVYRCPDCPNFYPGGGYGEDSCQLSKKYDGEITIDSGISIYCPLRELEINKK